MSEMNELVSAALGKYLVAAAPHGLTKVGFIHDDETVEIEEDAGVRDRLNVVVEGEMYASIDMSVTYWESDAVQEPVIPEGIANIEVVKDEKKPVTPNKKKSTKGLDESTVSLGT